MSRSPGEAVSGDPRRGRAVVSLVVRTHGDEMHTTTWVLPGCCSGRHVEQFRAAMVEQVGEPASEMLRSQEEAEALTRLATSVGGVAL